MKLGVGVSPTTSIVASQTAAVISAAGGGGGGPFTVDNANFNGSTTLSRSAPGLSGISDGKEWAFAFWFKMEDVALANTADEETNVIFTIRAGSSNKFLLQRSALSDRSNKLTLVGRNASGSVILLIQSTSPFTNVLNDGWNHVLCSGNLATGAKNLYINDVDKLESSGQTFTNDDIDFTGSMEIGRSADITDKPFYGSLAELWFDDSYIDFSVEANRRKWYSDGGTAVDLGADGSTPTGSSPLMYLHLDAGEAAANFALNAGTGGNFTVSAGSLTSDRDAPNDDPNIKTVNASRVFMWDASNSETTQTIINAEPSPADGSSQTTYDAIQGSGSGSDSRDPNYDSSGNYYSQTSNSSADYITMQGFKTTTTFTNSLHKDGAQYTIELGIHKPSSQGGFVIATAEDSNDTGISLQTYDDGRIQFTVHRGTNGSFCASRVSTSAIASGRNHIIISIDEGVTNGSFFYINDAITDTFTLTYDTPSTGNSTHNWHWLTSLLDANLGNPRFPMGQNDGVGMCAVYNKAVSAAEAAILYNNAPIRYQV